MVIQNIMKKSFFTNFFLSIFKVVSGIVFHSSALIADGIHSFSDLVTDVVAIVGNTFSLKPADREHPYGHGNFEYLTSIVIGSIIMIIGLVLIGSVIDKEIVIPNVLVVFVSIITIIVKTILSKYLIKKGAEQKNNILIASGKESSADVISSIIVLISGILMQFMNVVEIFKYADIIASIIVGLFIIHTGLSILKENISQILGRREEDEEFILDIKIELFNFEDVLDVDDIILIKIGPYYKVSIELSMYSSYSLKKAHDIAHNIEKILMLKYEKIKYVNIHVNPYEK